MTSNGIGNNAITTTVNGVRSPSGIGWDAVTMTADGTQSLKGIGSGTISTVPKATDEVAVSSATDASTGAGMTSHGMRQTDAVDPKTALLHGHALLAAAVLGRLSDAHAHTAKDQWRIKTDTLAPVFWNRATTTISNQPTSSTTAATPTSLATATTPTEPPRGAQSGATLQRGRPPDMAKQQAF